MNSLKQAIAMGFVGALAVFTASFFLMPTWVLFIAWVSYYLFGTKPKAALLVFIQQILGMLIAISIQYGGSFLTNYFNNFGFPIMVFIAISAVFYITKAKHLNNLPAYFLGMIAWFSLNSEPKFNVFLLLCITLIAGFTFAWINVILSQKIQKEQ